MSNHAKDDLQGIAIIGLSGRFPGAENVAQFWENLVGGVESVRTFEEDELSESTLDRSHPDYVPAGAVLEKADEFDAAFFDFLPSEAQITDPQQRLFLECSHEAMENAGYDAHRYDGRVGVFGGVGRNTYVNRLYANPDLIASVGNYPAAIGNDADFLATRVAYKLNLRGPAVTVQTACSTSLVAVHLACQSLLTYECDMALAGGAAIKTPQKEGYIHQESGIFSRDGHCRAFDAESDGTVLGNGVGIVLLKRLEDAVADGDHIYAVIKGSAINNDGSAKIGFTAPSVDRQADVIADALALADIDPATVSYVEAHGTGTALGDPIEITALTQAYRLSTDAVGTTAIGSVKTNIGHLDTAAGVTGLIKTALMLHHKQLPPSLHFSAPNAKIDFANSPFYVNAELKDWQTRETPRRAGVSSFGMGGTNAHAVLEEAPPQEQADPHARSQVLLQLSAKTGSALETMTAQLADALEANPALPLADVAYTLQTGRREFRHRRTVVAENAASALEALRSLDPKRVFTHELPKSEERSLVFLFSGQGSQYVNMGKDLYDNEPVFRDALDTCAELLQPHLGTDFRAVLYPSQPDKYEESQRLLGETVFTQPVLFAFEYALATFWSCFGIRPQAMAGHSIGEYVAACLAGVFTLEEALQLVAHRARLMQEMPRGSMLAVQLSEADAEPYLSETISLAGVNAQNAVVLAGPTDAVSALEADLRAKGVSVHLLDTSHAFHSSMMEPVLAEFEQHVACVNLQAPQMPYLSNVTGTWITAEQATDPAYYSRHLRQAVRFGDNVQAALEQPGAIILEVGPGRSLSSMARQIAAANGKESAPVLTSVRHKDEKQSDVAFLLNALGRLWQHGVPFDAAALYEGESRKRVPLPTYPFERQSYSLKPGMMQYTAKRTGRQANLADWFSVPVWKQTPPPVLAKGALENERWLVLIDEASFGAGVVNRAQELGANVTSVYAGEAFAELEPGIYTLNPANRDEYTALFKSLSDAGQLPTRIVHLWGIATSDRTLEQTQEHGLYSLVSLAQAVGELGLQERLQLSVITNNLQAITGETILLPERATILGAAKVIPQEYENVTCRAFDIDFHGKALVDRLIADLASPAADFLVAYRSGQRFVQGFEKTQLPASEQTALRHGGLYLVTGASEPVGLQLAEYLNEQIEARLLLIPRPNFPAPSEWESLVTKQDETAERIHRLSKLLATGRVMYSETAWLDTRQLKQSIAQATERFGELNGVIHTEEVVGQGLIQLKARDMLESVISAKLHRTLALEEATRGLELDLFAVFSRMLAVTGGFGQADNAAAAAFVDVWARSRQAQGLPAVALDYGMWSFDALPDNPMMPSELKAQFAALQDRFGSSFAEGAEAFERALHSGLPQVIISSQDLQAVIDDLSELTPSRFLNSLAGGRSSATISSDRPYIAPTNEVEQQIAGFWQELFGVEQVSIHDNFFELGGNSLLGVQLVNRVRNEFDVELPMSALFESGTVAELAAYIANSRLSEEEMDEIERMLREIEALSADEAKNKLEEV